MTMLPERRPLGLGFITFFSTGLTPSPRLHLSFKLLNSCNSGFDIALKCGCDGGSLGGFETASVTGEVFF